MLRTLLLVVVAVALTAALVGAIINPDVWPTVLILAVFLSGIVFERRRYGATQYRPTGGGWRETSERFIDEANGRETVVWFNPETGERRYVYANGDSINDIANQSQR